MKKIKKFLDNCDLILEYLDDNKNRSNSKQNRELPEPRQKQSNRVESPGRQDNSLPSRISDPGPSEAV